LAKPFNPLEKTWKKPGGRRNQMAYLIEKVIKLETRLKKARTKKLSKKHAHDSSNIVSNRD
jgi:hypothetical protein